MCGWQVKLCDPLVTHGPYLSCAIPVLCDSSLYVNYLMSAILINGDYYYRQLQYFRSLMYIAC